MERLAFWFGDVDLYNSALSEVEISWRCGYQLLYSFSGVLFGAYIFTV